MRRARRHTVQPPYRLTQKTMPDPQPTLSVRCPCGERFHTDGANRGRRVRCRRCGRVLGIRKSRAFASSRSRARATLALRFLTWGYLAAVVAIALTMWTAGDRWWPATVLLYMGRWVFLLPLVVLLPAAITLRRTLLAPLALAAIVVVGPVMGGRLPWRRLLPAPAGVPLRVVTLNADGGAAIAPQLLSLLSAWGADVVAFQECGEELAAATEHVPSWHWHHLEQLCLLSRYPIDSAAPMDRQQLARVKAGNPEIGGAGYVIRYRLATPAGEIGFTNLHLETPRKGFEGLMAGDLVQLRENSELRDLESTLARRWVDEASGPMIVAGDFNTPVESRIFQDHWGDLADAFSRAGAGLGITKYNGWISIRIDHVLTNDDWRVADVREWSDVGSDHRPLVAGLVLVPAKR